LTQTGIEAGCSSPKLTWLEPGHPASDHSCPNFRRHLISARQGGFWYQLKSQKSRIGESITDGAILKVEGSHRRQGYGGQERLKGVKPRGGHAPLRG
jgi:hypothetical protein